MSSSGALNNKEFELSIDGEKLIFDFRRAMYWPKKKILIIADMHIGKAGHFRKNGISISNSVALEDFERLEDLVNSYLPEELMILGDLSHSRMNKDWDYWLKFRIKHSSLKITLVPGNHDILPDIAYDHARILLTDSIHIIDPFVFIHESGLILDLELRQISGHIHPGVRLSGAARQGITLPCFHITETNITLPAFSGFTGRFKIKPKKNDKVIAITQKQLFLIE